MIEKMNVVFFNRFTFDCLSLTEGLESSFRYVLIFLFVPENKYNKPNCLKKYKTRPDVSKQYYSSGNF